MAADHLLQHLPLLRLHVRAFSALGGSKYDQVPSFVYACCERAVSTPVRFRP